MDFRIGYRRRLRTVSLLRKKRLRVRICIGAAMAIAATASAMTWDGARPAVNVVAAAAPAALVPGNAKAVQAAPARPVYPYSIVPGGVATRDDVQQRVDTDPVVAKHYASFDVKKAHAVVNAKPRAVHVSYRKGDKVYWTSKTVMLAAGETLLSDGSSQIRGRCGNRISDKAMLPVAMNEPTEEELDAASASADDPDGGSLQNASFALDDAAPSGSATRFQQLASTGQSDAPPATPYTRTSMPDMPAWSNGISRAMGMQPSSFLTVSSGPTDALAPTTEASETVTAPLATAPAASTPAQTVASTPVNVSVPSNVSGSTPSTPGTPSAAGPSASNPVTPALPVKTLPAGEIPEPATLWLSGAAFAAMLLAGRRKPPRRNG